jgi:site-specific DNA recombinase
LSEKIDTTCAAGKMVFRMMAVLNEFTRDEISERTSAALQHLTRTQRVGELKYGFDLGADGKTLVTNESEQATITKIVVLRQRKQASFGTICKILNALRIPTKQGFSGWNRHVVQAIYERASTA